MKVFPNDKRFVLLMRNTMEFKEEFSKPPIYSSLRNQVIEQIERNEGCRQD
uniref:Uncharacterized protein n=1 Tax=mine drainage metagenome TaxID=410659 RepID=E6QVG5_9ZZZZ